MSWRPLMSKRLYELRFTFKADDPRSAGLWDYLQRYYAGDKHMNPTLPMLVRPHTVDEPPVISAMYDEGHVEQRNVDGMSVDQVKKVMRELVELGSERSAHLLPAWQQPPHSL